MRWKTRNPMRWDAWFAWHPISTGKRSWLWLEWVWRRYHDRPWPYEFGVWEYTTQHPFQVSDEDEAV